MYLKRNNKKIETMVKKVKQIYDDIFEEESELLMKISDREKLHKIQLERGRKADLLLKIQFDLEKLLYYDKYRDRY